ncbi:hypothetical protein GCM10028895_12840 [Pontibacter rugosus]
MQQILAKLRFPFKFVLFGAAVCLALFVAEHINGRFRMNDFKVYYEAVQAFLHENQVYGIAFGLDTGFYKYSPATLLLFTPYSLFSFETARILHFLLLTCCSIGAVVFLYKLVNNYLFQIKGRNRLLAGVFVCVFIHLFRELHLGNINIILLLLVSGGVYYTLKSKNLRAGWLFAFVIITKPYFLLLLLPLVMHQKKKVLLHMGLALCLLVLIPSVFIGFADNIRLHQEWVQSMMAHGSYLVSVNTIEYLVHDYTDLEPLLYFEVYLFTFLGLIYTLFFLRNRKINLSLEKGTTGFMERSLVVECFLVIALIPNLVITDTEHFLLSLPLIVMLAGYIQEKKTISCWQALSLLCCFTEAILLTCLGSTCPES